MIDVSTFVKEQGDKPVAVFGLGITGLSVVKALRAAGADVTAWDDRNDPREKAAAMGANIVQFTPDVLKACGALVLSPGVPLHFPEPHPVVKMARDAGLEIICDVEILARTSPACKTIGVTGTNGKSTSVSLMYHVLKEAGIDAKLGGNIGEAVLSLDMPDEQGCFVLELSSYQLDLCPTFAPDIAVLLNITPDHIDRHGTEEGYAKAKEQIFGGDGTAIVGVDDEPSEAIYERLMLEEARRIIPISVTQKRSAGVYVDECGAVVHDEIEVGTLSNIIILQGAHNHQNAAAVYAALREFGLTAQQIFDGFKSFAGLAHRQFPVRTINGVTYINDSKATNAEAASKALMTHENIFWIVGGQAKEGGLSGLGRYMERVTHAFIIGEASNDFAAWFEDRNIDHSIVYTLDKATKAAHDMAQAARGKPGSGGVVLLSPACASWDQFKSFEDRGDQFAAQVMTFEGEE